MEIITVLKMDEEDLTNNIRHVIIEEIKSLLNEIKNSEEDNTLLSRKEMLYLIKR